jgi:hypothetical protein
MPFFSLPNFDLTRTTPFPNVRHKKLSVFVAIVLAFVGWALSVWLDDSEMFSRFGALIAISAVLLAFAGQLKGKHIDDWAKKLPDELELGAQLVHQIDDRGDETLANMPSKLHETDQQRINAATGLDMPSSAYGDKWLAEKLAGSPQHRDSLAEDLNRDLRGFEIAIVSVGTLIWGFGDLVHGFVVGNFGTG